MSNSYHHGSSACAAKVSSAEKNRVRARSIKLGALDQTHLHLRGIEYR
jgi:hypothetical protein